MIKKIMLLIGAVILVISAIFTANYFVNAAKLSSYSHMDITIFTKLDSVTGITICKEKIGNELNYNGGDDKGYFFTKNFVHTIGTKNVQVVDDNTHTIYNITYPVIRLTQAYDTLPQYQDYINSISDNSKLVWSECIFGAVSDSGSALNPQLGITYHNSTMTRTNNDRVYRDGIRWCDRVNNNMQCYYMVEEGGQHYSTIDQFETASDNDLIQSAIHDIMFDIGYN
jgi:hypothetical protein